MILKVYKLSTFVVFKELINGLILMDLKNFIKIGLLWERDPL